MHVNEEQLERFILDSGLVSMEDYSKVDKKAKKNSPESLVLHWKTLVLPCFLGMELTLHCIRLHLKK